MSAYTEARAFCHDNVTNRGHEVGIFNRIAVFRADCSKENEGAEKRQEELLSVPIEVVTEVVSNPFSGWRTDLGGKQWSWFADGPYVKIHVRHTGLQSIPLKQFEQVIKMLERTA